MFDELNKYTNQGHFFFKSGDDLRLVSMDVPELPGVYFIHRLAKGKIDLVYIGKSGTIEQNGKFKDQLLRGQINNKQEGIPRQEYFEKKCIEERIDALDIYWYVTFDDQHQDIPGFVEGLSIQRYFEVYGHLPIWNKHY